MLTDLLCEVLIPAFAIVFARRLPKAFTYALLATTILLTFATLFLYGLSLSALGELWILLFMASPAILLLLAGVFSALHTADEDGAIQVQQLVIVSAALCLVFLSVVIYCSTAGIDLTFG